MPMRPKTCSSPWHTHSVVSPGSAATYRIFEYGNETAK